MSLEIHSKAFQAAQTIPKTYSGEGKDISPPLEWQGVPDGALELALLCEDPDAPQDEPFVHWIAYKIPPNCHSLPEGLPPDEKVNRPVHLLQGMNSFDEVGYGGPMPPKRHGRHHYHFRLYALDAPLPDKPGLDGTSFKRLIEGHVIAEADLVGVYERH